MPDPNTDPVGAYWLDGPGVGTDANAENVNAREERISAYANEIAALAVQAVETPSAELAQLRAYFAAKYTLGAPIASFAPSDLSGLLGWYKADSLALSDGAAVSAWTDSSGAGHNLAQATGGSQPTYHTAQLNGLPAVTFDGTADHMTTSAFASPTAGCTVIAVLKQTPANAYRMLFNHAAQATWATPYARVAARLSDDAGGGGIGQIWQFWVEDATDVPSETEEGTVATSTWQLMEFVYDQTNLKIRRDGTQVATKARTGTLTSSTRPIFLGADTDLGEPFKGQVGELVYYGRGLDSTELGQVRTYLQGRWGL